MKEMFKKYQIFLDQEVNSLDEKLLEFEMNMVKYQLAKVT